MTNDEGRRNDEIRMTKKHSSITFVIRAFWLPFAFVSRASSFFSPVNDQFVPVRVAKLCHPAHRRFSLFHIEADTASFKFVDRGVDIFYLKSDRRTIAGWF